MDPKGTELVRSLRGQDFVSVTLPPPCQGRGNQSLRDRLPTLPHKLLLEAGSPASLPDVLQGQRLAASLQPPRAARQWCTVCWNQDGVGQGRSAARRRSLLLLLTQSLPPASTLKQADDGVLRYFFHFCKQRKEKEEILGGLETETGEGFVPCQALQSGARPQERGASPPPGCLGAAGCHREAGFSPQGLKLGKTRATCWKQK